VLSSLANGRCVPKRARRAGITDLSHPQSHDLFSGAGEKFGKMVGGTERRPWLTSQSQSQKENTMQIQINTDHNIEGHEALSARVRGVVESALSRISEHITRVEVHLSDESGHKTSPNDKRCMMEARLEGHQPLAVTHNAANVEQAVNGAADKLTRLIESTLGRLRDQKSSRTDPPPPGPISN
jgi:ribosome-associated translation inhibitor RaiA